MPHMHLPDFLIIGAMKSGTTGLYFDLGRHPRVFQSADKEPHDLCYDRVLSEEGRREYALKFSAAAPTALVGDASTGYAKRPEYVGVAERAKAVLGDEFRVIYMVRDPISRIISQHYHEYSQGLVGPDINVEVRNHPRYLDFSRYHWQLTDWVDALGRDRIRVIYFEEYKANRSSVVADTCRFLGLDPDELSTICQDEVFNSSENKPVPGPLAQRLRGSWVYKNLLRNLVSNRARHHLRKYVLARAPARPDPPSPETVAWLQDQLAEDGLQLQREWGPAPWGDLAAGCGPD